MPILFTNNAVSSLASSISAPVTAIVLATGSGAKFPVIAGGSGDYFYATLVGYDSNGVENAWEVVKVTARSGDTLTVTRAQDGTSAAIWAAGARIELRAPAAVMSAFVQTLSGVTTISGRVGIGLTPVANQGALQVLASGVSGGAPATSGTTDTNQIAELGAGSVQLSFGAYANGDAWIQQRSSASFATNYGLGINPNGGRIFFGGGIQEARVAMAASDINLSAGNYFTRTISGATTLTVSNTPGAGTAASFILDLTNGGSSTITWWAAIKWAGGTAPALTSSGRDVLAFYTHDGGTTWNGLVVAKDVK